MQIVRQRLIAAIACCGLLPAACAGPPSLPLAPEAIEPLIPERDLAGETVGRGEFSAINGVERSFTAWLDGTWDGETLTLVEDFEYDDGETDRKTWRLTRRPDGTYAGTREDVVGTATGYLDGDAFRLEYRVRLPGEDGKEGMVVSFRDVLVKRTDGVIVNTASVGKFGFRVGRVELTIAPADGGDAM